MRVLSPISPSVLAPRPVWDERVPSDTLALPHGAIRTGSAGRNLRTVAAHNRAVRPSGILSGTVVTNRGASVSSSFPSRPGPGKRLQSNRWVGWVKNDDPRSFR
jgi:hypothetical protein